MGIPSYYRRLVDKLPTLITKAHPGAIDWLWMDFNCLIYHCLRAPELRPYPGEAGRVAWEDELLAAVVRYTERVVGEVAPKEGVYIAVDGVVPLAKMRQQRLRRFKSSYEKAKETVAGPLPGEGLALPKGQGQDVPPWDSNAITPGTAFMSRLRSTLDGAIAKSGLPWKLSSADEPGEGEHKLMCEWRSGTYKGSRYAVYGLDADLIVLSLLNQDTLHQAAAPVDVWLFREDADLEEGAADTTFSWFDIQVLRQQLRTDLGIAAGSCVTLRDYCFAMSFLGNDFLPVSLSLKMREDGHEELLAALRRLRCPLLDPRTDAIRVDGLRELVGGFADAEEGRVRKSVDRKRMLYTRTTEELGLGEPNWAIGQFVEGCLLNGEERPRLREGWQETYRGMFLGRVKGAVAAEAYLHGIQWIWSYYRGETVCYNWMYPWNMPPLWMDVAAWLTKRGELPAVGAPVLQAGDVTTLEQLCLVLPPRSANLVPVAGLHRRFAAAAPWLFPVSFGFHSAGKRWFWECEPEIPIPTLTEVKSVLRELM
jgi:5'-3' exonuclease